MKNACRKTRRKIPPTLAGGLGRGDAASARKLILVLGFVFLALSLSACGFHPIYGTHADASGAPVASDLNEIAIDNIPNRKGQILRNDLIDRLYGPNRPSSPRYTLEVTINASEEDLGILANATSTRSMLDMRANFVLTDNVTQKPVLTGTSHSVASFDLLDQMYATVASRQDAYQRTLHEVSEQIVNRLSLYFSERKKS